MKEIDLGTIPAQEVSEAATAVFRQWFGIEESEVTKNRRSAGTKEKVKLILDNVYASTRISKSLDNHEAVIEQATLAIHEAQRLQNTGALTDEESTQLVARLLYRRGYLKEHRAAYGDISKLSLDDRTRILCFVSAAVDYMQHDIIGDYGPSQGMRIFNSLMGAGFGEWAQEAIKKMWGPTANNITIASPNGLEKILEDHKDKGNVLYIHLPA